MKAKIVYGRGTLARDVEFHIPSLPDDLFNGAEAEKLASLPSESILCTKRGTAKVKASEYPKGRQVQNKGFVISINRGTGSRIL